VAAPDTEIPTAAAHFPAHSEKRRTRSLSLDGRKAIKQQMQQEEKEIEPPEVKRRKKQIEENRKKQGRATPAQKEKVMQIEKQQQGEKKIELPKVKRRKKRVEENGKKQGIAKPAKNETSHQSKSRAGGGPHKTRRIPDHECPDGKSSKYKNFTAKKMDSKF